MALPTLAELLEIPTQDDALNQEVLPEVTNRGASVTGWFVGGVYRAMAYVVALMRVSVRRAVAAIAAAGFEDYAFGLAAAPNGIDVTSWASLVAKQRYGVDRIAATCTLRTITLTNVSSTSYGPIQPGPAVMVQFPSGNRYMLDEVVTIPANGTVKAQFRSEFAYDSAAGTTYNADPSGSTLTLITASYPGVGASNVAPLYSPTAQSGAGVGTVTPSGTPTDTPSPKHSILVRIDRTGTVAGTSPYLPVLWSTKFDGADWMSQTGSTAANLGGDNITVTLADNGGGPAFVKGSFYSFTTPGSDLVSAGRDQETPQQLGLRCRALWPSLAFAQDGAGVWIPVSPTAAAYEALTRSASSQVQLVTLGNSRINNQVVITVAGQGVLLSPATIASLQAFFEHFNMVTDDVLVQSAVQRNIVLAGPTITCKAALIPRAQQAMQNVLQLYINGGDAAALAPNGRIDRSWLVGLIRNVVGVTKSDADKTLTINAVAGDFQLPVTPGQTEVAFLPGSFNVATAFAWVPS